MIAERALAAWLLFSAGTIWSSPCAAVSAAAAPDRQPVIAQVWLDDTTSVDPRDRSSAIGNLLDDLTALTDKHLVDEWHVFGFGESAWSETPFHKASFARWHEPVCPPLTASGGENIFKWKERRRQEDHDRQCRQLKVAALAVYRSARKRSFEGLVEAVREHRPRPATCTGIGDLLTRISQDTSPRFVVVISDGSETCEKRGRLPVLSTPPSGVRTVFILTGSAASREAQSDIFRSRSEALMRSASWLTIMAPWGVHDDILDSHPRGMPQSAFGGAGDVTAAGDAAGPP